MNWLKKEPAIDIVENVILMMLLKILSSIIYAFLIVYCLYLI